MDVQVFGNGGKRSQHASGSATRSRATGGTGHVCPPARKSCRRCGINVGRVRRMRDRSGEYWCYACGKADSERKHGARAIIPCPRCGKACLRRDMVNDGGLHLCQTCGYDRALKGRELLRAGIDLELPHETEAKRRLRGMFIVSGMLALISLYRWGFVGG